MQQKKSNYQSTNLLVMYLLLRLFRINENKPERTASKNFSFWLRGQSQYLYNREI